jgi:hypothetical protein
MMMASYGDRLTHAIDAVASRRGLSVLIVGLLAFAGSATIGWIRGIAPPSVHDEFSYLLAADTFAHGRLTNPPHPMWIHFESFHVLQQPSYQSKYPPAQGLMLAAGQTLAGHPIAGVWLGFALMCSAICWMLYAWVPVRWAFIGGLLAVLHPELGLAGYWAQSYWGGAVAALGGALALGALRRLLRGRLATASVTLALGCGVLANSRPFEGLLLSLPIAVVVITWLINKKGPPFLLAVNRVFLPAFGLLTLIAAGMAYYNFRVTNDPLRLPYQVYERTYAAVPLFLWQKPRPEPTYRHQIMFDYQITQTLAVYEFQRTLRGFGLKTLFYVSLVIKDFLNVYVIPFIGVFGMMSVHAWRNDWARFGIVTFFFVSGSVLSGTYFFAHYFAPLVSLNYFFVLTAMRLCLWRDKKAGIFFIWFMPFLALCLVVAKLYVSDLEPSSVAGLQRARLLRQLARENGKHLIIVNYGPTHDVHHEWVYNQADIDNSKVVWARKMDRSQDCRLIDYFSERRAWLLELDGDQSSAKLAPYGTDVCQTNPPVQ